VTEQDASENGSPSARIHPLAVGPTGQQREQPRTFGHSTRPPDDAAEPHPERAGSQKQGAADPAPKTPSMAAAGDATLPPSVRRLATLAGSTTALTALLFYFGASRAYYFYDYLGVDSSLLSLTTRDYLQLSVDGLFVPILVAAFSALVLLWAHSQFRPRLEQLRRVSSVSVTMCVVGVSLMLNALSRVFVTTPLNRELAVAPLCLGAGASLLFCGMRMQRHLTSAADPKPEWRSSGEWLALLALIGLALFWAANDYSAEVGTTRAQQFVRGLPMLLTAQVYSAHSLRLSAPGVQETRCLATDAAYNYRYDGLKLVLQSGDAYLLLPAKWSPADGVAILLPRDNDVRLQFAPAQVPIDPGQPC